jgi:hypothetical protein
MGKDNSTEQTLLEKAVHNIQKIFKSWTVWIGLALVLLGFFLNLIITEDPITKKTLINLLIPLSTTFGSTFLSVALINVIYERWRDALMENKMEEMKNNYQSHLDSLAKDIKLEIQAVPDLVKHNMQSSIKKISDNVINYYHPCVPCNIYPPSKEEPKENDYSEFKTDLVKSMRESNCYSYSGVDMTIASHCIKYLFTKQPFPVIEKMVFIISDLNCKNNNRKRFNSKTGLYKEMYNSINKRKKEDKEKLINSIRTINTICSYTGYKINAVFYILPNRPPLHIHKTDGLCFWGVVDKTGQWECPTTYCYKQNDDKLSMFKTIEDLIAQTIKRVDEKLFPGHKFTITSWDGVDKIIDFSDSTNVKNTITYQCGNTIKEVSIEDFVNDMCLSK